MMSLKFKNITIRTLVTAAMFCVLVSAELIAAGTPAGTVIQSRSRVIFTTRSGAPADTAYSAVITIVVAAKAAVNITPPTGAFTTSSDSTVVDYAALVTNSGNAVDGVSWRLTSTRGLLHAVYRDGNGDGILQSGERSLGPITTITSIPADGQIPVIVRATVPRNSALDGVTDTTRFTVRSLFDTTAANTSLYATRVRTAVLNGASPGLTVNAPAPVAGQQVIYSFTLTNTGSVPAASVNLYDLLPSGVTFISGTTTIGSFSGSGNPVTWSVGTLSPGQSVTVTLTVQINANVAAGTIITNAVGMRYTVGSNTYSGSSNSAAVTVTGVPQYGVELTAVSADQTADASDTVTYRYALRNSGAFKDVIELSARSGVSSGWLFYRDGNANSSWDPSDPLLTNSNDSAGVDSDSVKIGDSLRVFVRGIMPLNDEDLLTDTVEISAVSAGDPAKSSVQRSVTTIRSPMVSITKTMLPAGDQPAGTVVTYKIAYANTGSVAVSQFSVTDAAPAQTNYVKNSVKVNDIAVSDNSGSVTVTTNAQDATVITVSIGTLAARAAGTVEFKVKIK